MLAGIVGVTLIGGLSNVSIAVTGPFVHNGILIFYGGFASFLVGVLASRADSTQKILTPDIVNIPFIDWMLMVSYALMNVTGLTFFMKSVKFSTPTIAVVMTKMAYILIMYTAYCILQQHVCICNPFFKVISLLNFCLYFSDSRYLGGNWVGGFVGFQPMSVPGIFHFSAVTSFTTKVFLVHGHVNLCVCFFIKKLECSKGYLKP